MKLTKNMKDYLTKQAKIKFEEWAKPYYDHISELQDKHNNVIDKATQTAIQTFIDTLRSLGCEGSAKYCEENRNRMSVSFPYYSNSKFIPDIDALNKKIDTARKQMNNDLERIFFEAEAGGDKDSILEAISNIKFD